MVTSWASGVRSAMKKVGSSAAGSFMGNVGADLAGRGIDMLTGQAQAVYDFEDNLQRLQTATKKGRGEIDATRIAFRESSVATGISSNKIAAAGRVYFDVTSDAEGLNVAMASFAKIAAASGSEIDDITNASASMRKVMGILPSEMEGAFGGLVEQGNEGKVGLRDMAGELTRLLPTFAKFGLKGREGLNQIGGMLQVVADDFKSPSEAATGLDQAMSMILRSHKQLAKHKIQVFDKTGKPKQLLGIIEQIQKKLPDERKWDAVFGQDAQARRSLSAVLKRLDATKEIIAAGEREGTIQRDFEARATSTAGKIQMSMNRAKEAMANIFTPERIEAFASGIERLADALPGIIDKAGALIDVLMKVPGLTFDAGKSIRGVFMRDVAFKDGGQDLRDEMIASARDGFRMKMLVGDDEFSKRARKFQPGAEAAGNILRGLTPEQRESSISSAEQRIAERARARSMASSIIAGESNERVSEESVRRAVMASISGDRHGAVRAGEAYLENAKVSPEKVDAIVQAAAQKSFKPLVDAIIAGIRKTGAPDVVIGNEPIAKAASNSRDHLRKGQ
jgi:TP901 family phage tail tape measure protein